jgi:hypothetical protein
VTSYRVSLARSGANHMDDGYVYHAASPPAPGDVISVERPAYSHSGRDTVRARVVSLVPATLHIYASEEK